MKKTYYLLLFVLMLSTSAKAQTDWIIKKLDEKMSAKFPVDPDNVTKNGVESYIAKGKDSIKYSSTLIDYRVAAHLDSATLAPIKDSQQFADQVRIGMASQKTNYTFGKIAIGKWNTYTTYNIVASENINKSKLLIRMILVGSKMYTFSCLVPANIATTNGDIFFNSIGLLK